MARCTVQRPWYSPVLEGSCKKWYKHGMKWRSDFVQPMPSEKADSGTELGRA